MSHTSAKALPGSARGIESRRVRPGRGCGGGDRRCRLLLEAPTPPRLEAPMEAPMEVLEASSRKPSAGIGASFGLLVARLSPGRSWRSTAALPLISIAAVDNPFSRAPAAVARNCPRAWWTTFSATVMQNERGIDKKRFKKKRQKRQCWKGKLAVWGYTVAWTDQFCAIVRDDY
ncbi:hypothetical protein T492DRAFT_832717 [Pavlovales sp. CCMP2436]|nr:hypothetical protein T492DRAFT_832717 [Pavlovales sp. CCMP2436]